MLWPDWRSAISRTHHRPSAHRSRHLPSRSTSSRLGRSRSRLPSQSSRIICKTRFKRMACTDCRTRFWQHFLHWPPIHKKPDTPSAARSAQARVQGGTRNEDAHVVTHTATPERAAAPDTGYIRHCTRQRSVCVQPKGLTQPLQRWRPMVIPFN